MQTFCLVIFFDFQEIRKHAHAFPGDSGGLDIAGTGGDGKNTFNVSTAAAFIIAAAGK